MSARSSAATSTGIELRTPCPISLRAQTIVTTPATGATWRKTLGRSPPLAARCARGAPRGRRGVAGGDACGRGRGARGALGGGGGGARPCVGVAGGLFGLGEGADREP